MTDRSRGPERRHHTTMSEQKHRVVRPSFACSVALATAFEVFLVLCTQDRAVMSVTPWQDDPYHAWVSLVVFALPMLLAVTAVRSVGAWLPWSGSDVVGRQRDLVKAGLVAVALVGATAVERVLAGGGPLGEHRSVWDGRTTWLVVRPGD